MIKRVKPESAQELSGIIRELSAQGTPMIPFGSGSRQLAGHEPPADGVEVHLTNLDRVIEHGIKDLVTSVELGMTLRSLQESLFASGQFWPYWEPDGESRTLGGILSTGSLNFFSYRYGGVRDLVLGLKVCLNDGVIAKSGGKVVKNVSGYEMPKLFIGSFGSLGFLLEASLRLSPIPEKTCFITAEAPDPDSGFRGLHLLFRSKLGLTGAFLRIRQGNAMMARVDGRKEFVRDQTEKIKSLWGTAGMKNISHGESHPSSSNFSPGENEIRSSGFVPPAALPNLFEFMKAAEENFDVTSDLLFSLQGAFKAGWSGEFNGASLETFQAFNQRVTQCGGWLAYDRVPKFIRRDWPMWGEERPEWELSVRLKKLFDPGNVFNPGRFVRRI